MYSHDLIISLLKKIVFVIVVSQNGRRAGMELQRFQRRVGVAGLRGTKWENCLHFFMNFPGEHTQPILFSPKTDPKKLLAYEKKVLLILSLWLNSVLSTSSP